jgi:cytosine/creatinine deaminase
MQIPHSHYWLTNAHISRALLPASIADMGESDLPGSRENLVLVDLEIWDGIIHALHPAGTTETQDVPTIDLKRGMVFPCFVDMHTHLDKGHIWGRSPNLSGRFDQAINLVVVDSQKNWHLEDVYRRMEFGLKCSYAHGTKAIRTHIDSQGQQAEISFRAFKTLQAEWRDRLTLQAVSLVSLDYFLTPEGEALADLIAETGSILGGLPMMGNELEAQVDRVFSLAQERDLDLDFHVDESGDPNAVTLRSIAAATIRYGYQGRVVCGHCCSLGVQSAHAVIKTLDLVKQAGIGIVSLPMCNLYLQDRNQQASENFSQSDGKSLSLDSLHFPTQTPRWRGVTLLHELMHSGIPVAVASDNCRDPFYGFGDHDALEVLNQSTRIAHLDAPYSDWCRVVTSTPADLMKLPQTGQIEVGLPADLVLFKARYFSELFSRPQPDRTVLRNGEAIDTTLPDYAELDDLLLP